MLEGQAGGPLACHQVYYAVLATLPVSLRCLTSDYASGLGTEKRPSYYSSNFVEGQHKRAGFE